MRNSRQYRTDEPICILQEGLEIFCPSPQHFLLILIKPKNKTKTKVIIFHAQIDNNIIFLLEIRKTERSRAGGWGET